MLAFFLRLSDHAGKATELAGGFFWLYGGFWSMCLDCRCYSECKKVYNHEKRLTSFYKCRLLIFLTFRVQTILIGMDFK